MTDELVAHRLDRHERAIDELRKVAARIEVIEVKLDDRARVDDARHAEIREAIAGLMLAVQRDRETAIDRYREFAGHIRECEARRKWTAALWIAAIGSAVGTLLQWIFRRS